MPAASMLKKLAAALALSLSALVLSAGSAVARDEHGGKGGSNEGRWIYNR